jgi:glucokinase
MSVIALDLGGTYIKGGLFSSSGILLSKASVATPAKEGKDAILDAMAGLYRTLDDGGVSALGVASAGDIDPETGVCTYATDNLPGWTGCHIKEELQNRCGVTVYVDNDAFCAGLSERKAYGNPPDFTLLTFGTGVGGATFIGGNLVRGELSKWGHHVIVGGGRPCNCGKLGCAEQYLSAKAFLEEAKRHGFASARACTGKAIAGDEPAERVAQEYCRYLNLLIHDVEQLAHSSLIVLGGGLMEGYEAFEPFIRSESAAVKKAIRGNEAGIYGAYMLTEGKPCD